MTTPLLRCFIARQQVQSRELLEIRRCGGSTDPAQTRGRQ